MPTSNIILFILAISLCACAPDIQKDEEQENDTTGLSWSGSARLETNAPGKNKALHECPSVNYRINQTGNKFVLGERKLICLGAKHSFEKISLNHNDGELFSRNRKVGKISDNEFEFVIRKSTKYTITIIGQLTSKNRMILSEQHKIGHTRINVLSQLEIEAEEDNNN